MVEFGDIKTIKENVEIDWGTLVGVVNKKRQKEEIIPKDCYQVGIGKGLEVSSMRSLRKKTLDWLVFFWEKESSEISM